MKKPIILVVSLCALFLVLVLLVVVIISVRKTLAEGPLPPGMPHPVPCQIMVTQDGKPLEDATVIFYSVGSSRHGWSITGKSDKKGVARMKVQDTWSGAIPGEYNVTITKDVSRAQTVDPKYASLNDTPVKIEVKRSLKLKIELGPAVNIPHPVFSSSIDRTEVKKNTPAEVSYYPCNITLLRNGEPLEGVEIEFTRAHKGPKELTLLMMDFKAVSDSNGLASFYSEEKFGDEKQKFEGIPVGEYTIFGWFEYEAYDERFKRNITKHTSYKDKFVVTEDGLEMTIDVAEFER